MTFLPLPRTAPVHLSVHDRELQPFRNFRARFKSKVPGWSLVCRCSSCRQRPAIGREAVVTSAGERSVAERSTMEAHARRRQSAPGSTSPTPKPWLSARKAQPPPCEPRPPSAPQQRTSRASSTGASFLGYTAGHEVKILTIGPEKACFYLLVTVANFPLHLGALICKPCILFIARNQAAAAAACLGDSSKTGI